MLGRALIGMVLSGGLSLGALYVSQVYLGLESYQYQDFFDHHGEEYVYEEYVEPQAEAETESETDVATEIVINGETEPQAEPALPAEAEADLVAWLASVLAGETAVDVREFQGDAIAETIDLAAYAANAMGPQPERPENPQLGDTLQIWYAECPVVEDAYLGCFIASDNRWWDEEFEGELMEGRSVAGIGFDLQLDETGAWTLVDGSAQFVGTA